MTLPKVFCDLQLGDKKGHFELNYLAQFFVFNSCWVNLQKRLLGDIIRDGLQDGARFLPSRVCRVSQKFWV